MILDPTIQDRYGDTITVTSTGYCIDIVARESRSAATVVLGISQAHDLIDLLTEAVTKAERFRR